MISVALWRQNPLYKVRLQLDFCAQGFPAFPGAPVHTRSVCIARSVPRLVTEPHPFFRQGFSLSSQALLPSAA